MRGGSALRRRHSARAKAGALALAALYGLAGCAQDTAGPNPATTASTPGTPDLAQFTPPPGGLVDEDTGETVEPQPAPEWDGASRAAAVKAADNVLRTFARPALDHKTWWGGLEPLLTPQAAADYSYVDPANIPALEVTGPGLIIIDTSPYAATVEIPTTSARYHVVLIRAGAEAPWLASRIAPVAKVG